VDEVEPHVPGFIYKIPLGSVGLSVCHCGSLFVELSDLRVLFGYYTEGCYTGTRNVIAVYVSLTILKLAELRLCL
jgi:hypothetical protein